MIRVFIVLFLISLAWSIYTGFYNWIIHVYWWMWP
jgi:hypothetical protein